MTKSPRRANPFWLALPGAVLAIALILALPGPPPPKRPADETHVKGTALITLYVLQGEERVRWDGRTPVKEGDRLQIQLEPEGLTRVYVLSGATLLHQGAVAPRGTTSLPMSWRVEQGGGAERLSVILSRSALTREELAKARTTNDLVRVDWVIPKATP
jgi:hypothetical protein